MVHNKTEGVRGGLICPGCFNVLRRPTDDPRRGKNEKREEGGAIGRFHSGKKDAAEAAKQRVRRIGGREKNGRRARSRKEPNQQLS